MSGISVVLILLRKRFPGALAAWVCYLVVVAPNLGFFRIVMMLAASRYSYVATMSGFVLAAGAIAALRPWSRPWPFRAAAVAVSLALVACLIPETWNQCRAWRDTESLWGQAEAQFARDVKSKPGSADAHFNLAFVLLQRRRYNEAAGQLRECLALDPQSATLHFTLARLLAERGQINEAIAEFKSGIRLTPDVSQENCELAILLAGAGQLDEAAAALSEALRVEPGSKDARTILEKVQEEQARR